MISVQHVPLILFVLAFVLAGSALSRLAVPRIPLSDERIPQLYRWLAYGMRVVLPLFAVAVIYYVTICLPLMPVAPGWVRWGLYLCLLVWAILEFAQTWSIPTKVLEGGLFTRLVAPTSFLGGLVVSVFLLMSSPILFQGDSADIQLKFPGEDEWLVIHGGTHPAVNMYATSERQRYAVEMVRLESSDLGRRLATGLHSPIMAPTTGTIVTVMDGYPDFHQSEYFEDQLGNYVTISMSSGVYVILGHLLPGSVQVEIGDSVEVGQAIAVASSGRLHLRVQDQPEFGPDASTRPFSFLEIRRKRFTVRLLDETRVIRNDVVSSIGE